MAMSATEKREMDRLRSNLKRTRLDAEKLNELVESLAKLLKQLMPSIKGLVEEYNAMDMRIYMLANGSTKLVKQFYDRRKESNGQETTDSAGEDSDTIGSKQGIERTTPEASSSEQDDDRQNPSSVCVQPEGTGPNESDS